MELNPNCVCEVFKQYRIFKLEGYSTEPFATFQIMPPYRGTFIIKIQGIKLCYDDRTKIY